MLRDGRKEDKIGYWLKALERSKDATKRHWQQAIRSYQEYDFSRKASDASKVEENEIASGFSIFWARCQILEIAYYSEVPKTVCRRKFDFEDVLGLTQILILERLGDYLIENSGFDEAFRDCRMDLIHAAKTTSQLIYKENRGEQRVTLKALEGEDGLYTEDGKAYNGEYEEDESGPYYMESVLDEDSQEILLDSVVFDEILHSPKAKNRNQINWIAYKICLSRDEAEKRFKDKDGNPLPLPYKKGKKEEGLDQDEEASKLDSYEDYIELWEIYCKDTKSVYLVCEDYKEDFLDKYEDQLNLRGFFPSPKFALTSKRRKSLYPTPPFVYLEATLNQLHFLYERIFKLIDGIRRRCLVQGEEDLIAALNLEDQAYVAVPDLSSLN